MRLGSGVRLDDFPHARAAGIVGVGGARFGHRGRARCRHGRLGQSPLDLCLRSALAEPWIDDLVIVDQRLLASVSPSALRALQADRRDVTARCCGDGGCSAAAAANARRGQCERALAVVSRPTGRAAARRGGAAGGGGGGARDAVDGRRAAHRPRGRERARRARRRLTCMVGDRDGDGLARPRRHSAPAMPPRRYSALSGAFMLDAALRFPGARRFRRPFRQRWRRSRSLPARSGGGRQRVCSSPVHAACSCGVRASTIAGKRGAWRCSPPKSARSPSAAPVRGGDRGAGLADAARAHRSCCSGVRPGSPLAPALRQQTTPPARRWPKANRAPAARSRESEPARGELGCDLLQHAALDHHRVAGAAPAPACLRLGEARRCAREEHDAGFVVSPPPKAGARRAAAGARASARRPPRR